MNPHHTCNRGSLIKWILSLYTQNPQSQLFITKYASAWAPHQQSRLESLDVIWKSLWVFQSQSSHWKVSIKYCCWTTTFQCIPWFHGQDWMKMCDHLVHYNVDCTLSNEYIEEVLQRMNEGVIKEQRDRGKVTTYWESVMSTDCSIQLD